MTSFTPGPWTWDKRESAGGAPVIGTDRRRVATVWFHNGSDDPEVHDNARLIAASPTLLAACAAHQAWAKAEDENLGTFHDRCELCSYAQWLTRKALAEVAGEPFDEEYDGVPNLIAWPAVELRKRTEEQAASLTAAVLSSAGGR